MSSPPAAPWPLALRVAFRFWFAYLVLFFFPLPSGLADPEWLSGALDPLWHAVAVWVGAHALHLSITIFSNGSGDTTYDYVRILCMAILAGLATVVWSVLDRRRTEYTALHGWGRLWMRYALAMSMFTYGIVKVIKLQFPDLGYSRLTETYGESSPMGLLWTFMGFSTAYTFFAGAGEILSAVLLVFRRTATLGALVTIGVMSQVVALNFSYDVPVKIGSTHLLMLAIFLAAPHAPALARLFFLQRPTELVDLGPHVERLWLRRAGIALKLLVLASVFGMGTVSTLQMRAKNTRATTGVDGAYAVATFVEEGKEVPDVASDLHRWKTVILRQGYVRFWAPDRSSKLFKLEGDPAKEPFSLLKVGDDFEPLKGAPPAGKLRIELDGDRAKLEGAYEERALVVTMRKVDPKSFPLNQRGFHWISEYPFNH
jgi:hypothetical protein